MILGFTKRFPDGEPTLFREKILMPYRADLRDIMRDARPKIHSMRAGTGRWKVGMSIQMAYGVRTKSYEPFNQDIPELQQCISVEHIRLKLEGTAIRAWAGGYELNDMEVMRLIYNDGLTRRRFTEWFFAEGPDWEGTLIHWTEYRYAPRG